MTFHVGQKVVCVDDKNWGHPEPPLNWPVTGRVYTVRGFSAAWDENGSNGLLLAEVSSGNYFDAGEEVGFKRRRFRPIVETKTDISIFKRMLTPQRKSRRVEVVE